MNIVTTLSLLAVLHAGGFLFLLGFRPQKSALWACLCTVLAAFLAFSLPISASYQHRWLQVGSLPISLEIKVDTYAKTMLILIYGIGLLVQIYSSYYLKDDPNKGRYFGFLLLFLGAMLGLVLSQNLLFIYLFWELVGACSYALIGFWYQKPSAAKAAKKAFLINRIADTALLIGILLYYQQFNSFSLDALAQVNEKNQWLGLFLMVGCLAKSAQFPFYMWLPDAMEGPTPVSALIHAATMVAAGVFLLLRLYPVFTPDVLFVLACVGCITMLIGAFSALFQSDLKKILVYSTISQLGLMVLSIGIQAPHSGFFHLTTHAFFKAGLFLGAGIIIHLFHSQNIFEMGGLWKKNRIFSILFFICSAALVGLPFFSGFLSKESILMQAFAWPNQPQLSLIFGFAILLASVCTAFYVGRMLFFVFFQKSPSSSISSISWWLLVPVSILAFCSLFIAFSPNPFAIEKAWFWSYFSETIPHATWITVLAMLCSALGLFLGIRYAQQERPDMPLSGIKKLLVMGLGGDILYQKIGFLSIKSSKILHFIDKNMVNGLVNGLASVSVAGANLMRLFDETVVDGLVNATANTVGYVGNKTRTLQQGTAQKYLLVLLLGLALWLLLL